MWVSPKEHRVVGAVLAEFRAQARFRQQDLAAKLGKPQSFVSAYESGQRRVDVLELARIASAMGLDAREVFAEIVRQHGVACGAPCQDARNPI